MRKFAPIMVTAAALVGVLATPAIADPVPLNAPYAQAAAEVSATGVLLKAKNVDEVRKTGLGRYCVKVDDSIDLARSLVQVERINADRRTYQTTPSPTCENAASTITVWTYTSAGQFIDGSFTVAVL
ncbi:hypothetical protein [Streptomyces vinaceus]|uniref:hypothetical protein n=1 Tax=Streptomyces vinaceus TaxID=1960 RepID=UPI0036CA9548